MAVVIGGLRTLPNSAVGSTMTEHGTQDNLALSIQIRWKIKAVPGFYLHLRPVPL